MVEGPAHELCLAERKTTCKIADLLTAILASAAVKCQMSAGHVERQHGQDLHHRLTLGVPKWGRVQAVLHLLLNQICQQEVLTESRYTTQNLIGNLLPVMATSLAFSKAQHRPSDGPLRKINTTKIPHLWSVHESKPLSREAPIACKGSLICCRATG